jgi:hypothetical protein
MSVDDLGKDAGTTAVATVAGVNRCHREGPRKKSISGSAFCLPAYEGASFQAYDGQSGGIERH